TFLPPQSPDQESPATLCVARYRLALWTDFTFFLNNPLLGDEIEQDDLRTFAGARLDYHFHRRWHGLSFRTTFGAEVRYDDVHVDRWDAESQDGDFRKRIARRADTSGFAFSGNNDDVTQVNVAAFAEEDLVVNRWFRAIAALRA